MTAPDDVPDICERHGGPWGEDQTCARCTDADGNPRTTPGPLGPGASDPYDRDF